MTASISFTDAIGAAVLTNGKPMPGGRFSAWTPNTVAVGDAAELQSTGARVMFKIRDDYTASFELRGIPCDSTSGLLDIADRLTNWLESGGTCAVATGDAVGSTYATCGIAKGAKPTLKMSDPKNIEYTLTLALVNLAGTPVRMVCRYKG